MKKSTVVWTGICVFLLAVSALSVWNCVRLRGSREQAVLALSSGAVRRHLSLRSGAMQRRLESFAARLKGDRDFAMTVLVAKQLRDPLVTGYASRYMEPMGFTFLEIAGPDKHVLSSGHFPAGYGRSAQEKIDRFTGDSMMFFKEKVRGKVRVTFQGHTTVDIARRAFHCMGGVVVDSVFLSSLLPRENVAIIFVWGELRIATIALSTLSPLEGQRIVVNGTARPAVRIDCPGIPSDAGDTETPHCIVVLMDAAGSSPHTLSEK